MRSQLESRLLPLHVEVHGDGDAVVLVVDLHHLVDVHANENSVRLFCG